MEHIASEIFETEEFTIACVAELRIYDEAVWDDDQPFEEAAFRGIFAEPYESIRLGRAGQDSTLPTLRFLTAQWPDPRESDEVVITREVLNVIGAPVQINTTYRILTPQPNGRGTTECSLYKDD